MRFRDPSGHRPCGSSCPNDVTTWELQFGSAWYGPWDVNQQAANAAKAEAFLVAVSETAVGILWEPADWVIALSDGAQWYDGLGMLPVLPAAFGDNVGRAITRFIPAGWEDGAGQALGHWVNRNLGNADWARYQTRVTGVVGAEFMFNGVRFDGIIGSMDAASEIDKLVLLDAKHWSWGFVNQLQNNQTLYSSKLDDAVRQIKAANGVKIQWHFHVKEVADWWRDQLLQAQITGIDVVYTP